MGQTRRNCPVFGCGSTNLVRLANHLEQVHRMNGHERARWLKWSKLGVYLPIQATEVKNAEVNTVGQAVETLIKHQEEMAANFNMFLTQPVLNETKTLVKRCKKRAKSKNACLDKQNTNDIEKQWLT